MKDKRLPNASILSKFKIFSGMNEFEIIEALSAFNAQKIEYHKNSVILHAGSKTENIGLVLSGSVTIESNDLWGNRTILTLVNKGGFFAETYALLHETLLVDAVANETSDILFLKVGSLSSYKVSENSWSLKVLSNLLSISARKNLILSARSFDTAPSSIRGRVMSYLNAISLRKHSKSFEIPFNRQQMADYLNVERTALSKELGKMKKENLIDFQKNHFTLM